MSATTTSNTTSNPAFSDKLYARARETMSGTEKMTIAGACNRSLVLIAIVAAVAWVTGTATLDGATWAMPALIGGAIGGLIVALVTIFKPHFAPVTGPLYALLEGVVVGVLSALMNVQFDGIVIQAVAGTFVVFMVMLVLYRTRVIKVTARFRMIVIGATVSIFFFYLVVIVLGLFGVNTEAVMGGGTLSIIISAAIIVVAALNLALDFDFIEQGAAAGLPRQMEWYAAFGLLVTLIWLYLEILRLLAATRR